MKTLQLTDTIGSILQHKGAQVFSVSPTATVYEAIEKMAETHVGALLVLEGDTLVGIISERDYARKVILQGKLSKQTLVQEIMTSPVIFVTPEEPVEECMRMMTNYRIRHLPIVDQGKVMGVISIGDLVKWIISEQEKTIHQLRNYITGTYPA